jgi:2-methylisocitrate lyase-like PEP mutase family enzyme
MSAQPTFAALHRPGGPFLLPNAWDVSSALLLADAGFAAVGTTSLGVTAAAGEIDGAGTGRGVTMALARAILPRLSVPVSIDAEGGYSDEPGAVAELAVELAELGAAGINLEDGRADGGLRSAPAHAAIIRAVVAAAPGLFVNARTDVYWLRAESADGRLDAATARLLAYQDAGASGVFVPGLSELAGIAALTRRVRLPLNVLWRPGTTLAQLGDAGVARVSTGSALYRRALAAAVATAVAAQHDQPPPDPDVPYDSVLAALQPPPARISGH